MLSTRSGGPPESDADEDGAAGLAIRLALTFTGRAVAAAGTIAISFVVANTLGLAVLGDYTRFVAIMLGLALLARYGTTPLIQKHCGSSDSSAELQLASKVYRDSVALGNRLAAAGTVIGFAVLVATDKSATTSLALIACVPLTTYSYTNAALLRARKKAHLAPLLEFGSVSLVVALIVGLAATSGAAVTYNAVALTTFVVSVAIAAIGRSWITRATPGAFRSGPRPASASNTARGGVDFFLVEASQYFSQWGLLLFVGYLMTDSDLARFSALQRVAFLVNFVLGVTSNTVSTQVATLHRQGNQAGLAQLRRRSRLLMLAYAVPTASLLMLFRSEILDYFQLGEREDLTVFSILLTAQIANVATGISPVVLRMTGHERALRNIILTTLCVQLIGSWVLIDLYGTTGAALGFAGGLLTKNGLSMIFESRLSKRKKTLDY